jgi:DNA-binding NarL/FixJ family response regulator
MMGMPCIGLTVPSPAGVHPRVAIAASHAAVRGGLRALMASDRDMDLIAIVDGARAAARCVLQHHPDVLVLAMPGALADGGALVRELRTLAPDTAVVVASTGSGEAYTSIARAAGADALVALDGPSDELLDAVHGAAVRGR